MATYYIDGTTLSNSNAVFTDAAMTNCAPDGFYSDGTIVRQLLNCVLLPQQTCPTCAEPCGGTISASGSQGIYLLDLDAGGTASDVGAMIVTFDPASVPDGIRATYNGTVYNKLSSPVDGYHGSTNPSNFTYVGNSGSDCGISGSTYNLNEYEYTGGAFVATGNTQSITVNAGDVSLGSSPGNCVMVIPKISATPSLVQFEFVGPCSGTVFGIGVSCPALLTGYTSNANPQPATSEACGHPLDTTYYNAPVNGTAGNIGLYDWVFSDANGQFVLSAGYYRYTGGWYQVDANGVIIAMGTCALP